MYSNSTRFSSLLLLVFSIVFSNFSPINAQDYKKGWDALGKNDFKTAQTQLENALKDPNTAVDAAISLMFMESVNNHEANGQAY
jgi:hypothetical protein